MIEDDLIQELSTKFDIQLVVPEGTKHSFEAADLVKEENMREFIKCYRPMMRALDDTAVAAYFANWFSNVAMALQYSLSVYNVVPDMGLTNLVIHLIPTTGYCRVVYMIKQWKTSEAHLEGLEREEWRQHALEDFYRNTAYPLVRSMSATSGLASSQIWGQLPTKFNYYLEMMIKDSDHTDTKKQLEMDYECLKNELSPDLFGLPKNPFQVEIRRIEDIADPEKTVAMRNRCCLYYLTEGGNYCYTCPRLKEEDRAKRREDYRKQATTL